MHTLKLYPLSKSSECSLMGYDNSNVTSSSPANLQLSYRQLQSGVSLTGEMVSWLH